MAVMKRSYVERIYAGWLAKIIGIRLGAPVEGWTYEQIRDTYGDQSGYLVDYQEFAADDDSNGPLFFLRALEDCGKWENMESQDVAEALLNYAPFEHGFFWWGGYGVSTEHTAYLNLRNGIKAPKSGSIEQNGSAAAEQIGGQIFIDTWGLVAPGKPALAAALAEKAASVTHGGNGVYGGIFIAACISAAFEETDIRKMIETGLRFIPEHCEYAKVVRAVMQYHEKNPESWEECFRFIKENYGYDRYPGVCHIIPNSAVIILSLLYGEGEFSRTLQICNRCGWDTDCNVGNVATIMGVRNGLEGIDYETWRRPVHDFLACSSVMGSMNIMDIPYGAAYIAKLSAILAGEELPEPYGEIVEKRIDSCHFEYPGSTHAVRVRIDDSEGSECMVKNTEEAAATGNRSLKVIARPVQAGKTVSVYRKTYYRPCDFHDSRYDPAFSPLVYPGQTIHGSVRIPSYGIGAAVSLYAKELRSGMIYESEAVFPEKDNWETLEYRIPALEGSIIEEVGFRFYPRDVDRFQVMTVFIDDLYTDGVPAYTIEFGRENEEFWTGIHREISQFTKLRGLLSLENGQLHLSCADFAECYTGHHTWKDYSVVCEIIPQTGTYHLINVRVQGAIRSYAAGLLPDGRAGILKNKNGYQVLNSCAYPWQPGGRYEIGVKAVGNRIVLQINGKTLLSCCDEENPYLAGAVGLTVLEGGHCRCQRMKIDGIRS